MGSVSATAALLLAVAAGVCGWQVESGEEARGVAAGFAAGAVHAIQPVAEIVAALATGVP
jgi:hypothetical protein